MQIENETAPGYRGRLAPSPTGYLHVGHARTFWIGQQRALATRGRLILRNDDLDRQRCKPEFVQAMMEDLRWFGFDWQEGPDIGGKFGYYSQSERQTYYLAALKVLQNAGAIYPCICSRKDIQSSVSAPHAADDEPIYPGTCRNLLVGEITGQQYCWRFRVPDGERVEFDDGYFGRISFVAGRDFGDFVVWRPDQIAAYQLATVVDDVAMCITEVVRGADLLVSTARQILLFRALGLSIPRFYHCELMTDASGARLAKRHDSISLRQLRKIGMTPEEIREHYFVIKAR